MTLKEHEQLARQMADDYLTSRSHDEHLAEQRQEVRDGVRKWKK
ncbi:hypothetical protein [Vagococcus fluvialis]